MKACAKKNFLGSFSMCVGNYLHVVWFYGVRRVKRSYPWGNEGRFRF